MIDPTHYGAVHNTAESGIPGAELVGYRAPHQPEHFAQEALSFAVTELPKNDEAEESQPVEGSQREELTPAGPNTAVPSQVAAREVNFGQIPNSTSHGDEPSSLPGPDPDAGNDITTSLTAEKSRSPGVLCSLFVCSLFGSDDSAAPEWQPVSKRDPASPNWSLEEQRLGTPPNLGANLGAQ